MNNREAYEFINTFNDFQRVARYGSGVSLNGRILDRDFEILKNRENKRKLMHEPLVGDWVIMPNGVWLKIAYDWDEMGCQLCKDGSFSLHDNGKLSMSGSLMPMIKKESLRNIGKFHNGECWFFSEGYWGAHRGVYVLINCRVWEYCSENLPSGYEEYKKDE